MSLYQNRIVVKVGTSTLTNEMGKSDLRSFDRLACVLSDIQNMGYEVSRTKSVKTVSIYYRCETSSALYYNIYEKAHKNNCCLKNRRYMRSP